MCKTTIEVEAPNLRRFKSADQYTRNRLLLAWLSDDAHRATFYELVNGDGGELEFPSRDCAPPPDNGQDLSRTLPGPQVTHKPVRLITGRNAIQAILLNAQNEYSNRVYAALDGGQFMLALDPQTALAHGAQRAAFRACFTYTSERLGALSLSACEEAFVTALVAPQFDLADFAEQCALRFCHRMMGYALPDYPIIEKCLREAYAALVYQVLGRHFVTDPTVIPTGQGYLGELAKLTSELIDAYASKDVDALKYCALKLPGDLQEARPVDSKPALQRLAEYPADMNGAQRAITAMGAAVGTIGNVQAAACIAVKAMFGNTSLWDRAMALLAKDPVNRPTTMLGKWQDLIAGTLSDNPPIPFLPRIKVDKTGAADGEVVLALGGGTLGGQDPLIWGLPETAVHWCAGMPLAWPLIVEIVRQVMALPGLAEALCPTDAKPIGLKKRWGFACESYPLMFQRDKRVEQSSLNVAMRLKSPAQESAVGIRAVLHTGAPRISEALRQAGQVHFAWFELIDNDSVLVLHTVYDGPFDAYIQDFALKIGDLFDLLFQYIETPPPMPVTQYPDDFVALIKIFDQPPVMNYLFTAYPRVTAATIVSDAKGNP